MVQPEENSNQPDNNRSSPNSSKEKLSKGGKKMESPSLVSDNQLVDNRASHHSTPKSNSISKRAPVLPKPLELLSELQFIDQDPMDQDQVDLEARTKELQSPHFNFISTSSISSAADSSSPIPIDSPSSHNNDSEPFMASFPAQLIHFRELTSVLTPFEHVFEITLACLPLTSENSHNNLDFARLELELSCPGNVVGILPKNNSKQVEKLIRRLHLEQVQDRLCQLVPRKANNYYDGKNYMDEKLGKGESKLPYYSSKEVNGKKSVLFKPKMFLLHDLDFQGLCTRRQLMTLSLYCSEDSEKSKLQDLAQNITLYQTYVERKCISLIDILDAFPSCQPDLVHLIDAWPRIAPRYYSITQYRENKITIIFKVVNKALDNGDVEHSVSNQCGLSETSLLTCKQERNFFKGLCTNWLHEPLLKDQLNNEQEIEVIEKEKQDSNQVSNLEYATQNPIPKMNPNHHRIDTIEHDSGNSPSLDLRPDSPHHSPSMAHSPISTRSTTLSSSFNPHIYLSSPLNLTLLCRPKFPLDFTLPLDPLTPIIMIATGTGIAPFMGFMNERQNLLSKQTQLGYAWLFAGFRDPNYDWLYHQEIERFMKSKALDQVTWAFSRAPSAHSPDIGHIQDRMLEDGIGKALLSFMQGQQAVIYICGNLRLVTKSVRETWVQLLQHEGGMNEKQALETIMQWTRSKRWLLDIWG